MMVQARRQEGLQAACIREAARYEVRRADVQGCIHSAEQDIEVAKADLATAQVFREHQQEYEVRPAQLLPLPGWDISMIANH